MRPSAAAAQSLVHLSPPLSSQATAVTCDPNTCRWRPYANSKDFEANAAMILIILLCALICALALNASIRCFLRRPRPPPDRLPETQQKPNLVAPPALVYSAGMKLAGAEAECAICLSEFVDGEGIRVLASCKHGFHVQCIQEWLSSHSSCPTCRGSCLPPSDEIAAPTMPESQRGPEQL